MPKAEDIQRSITIDLMNVVDSFNVVERTANSMTVTVVCTREVCDVDLKPVLDAHNGQINRFTKMSGGLVYSYDLTFSFHDKFKE